MSDINILTIEIIAALSAQTSWRMMKAIHAKTVEQILIWNHEFWHLLVSLSNWITLELLSFKQSVVSAFELELSQIFSLAHRVLIGLATSIAHQSAHCLWVLWVWSHLCCSQGLLSREYFTSWRVFAASLSWHILIISEWVWVIVWPNLATSYLLLGLSALIHLLAYIVASKVATGLQAICIYIWD